MIIKHNLFIIFLNICLTKNFQYFVNNSFGYLETAVNKICYKLSFMCENYFFKLQMYIFSERKFERCVSTIMDVEGQVIFQELETFIMDCRAEFKLEKKST